MKVMQRSLTDSLQDTKVAPFEPQSMIILRRVADGIRGHWDARASEWLMLYPAVGMGFALTIIQPDMFDAKSFTSIARLGDEGFWAFWVLFCALVRLVALTVNGTFKGFRFSPHMRVAASIVGIAFWSQFTLGFVNSWIAGLGAFSAVIAYSTFCLAELLNFTRSWKDIGRSTRKR